MSKKTLLFFTSFLLSFVCMLKGDENKTLSILFIGNSYTRHHNIPDQVRDFLERGDPGLKVRTSQVIYGGSQAERHWNNYGTANLLNLSRFNRQQLVEQKLRLKLEVEGLGKVIDQAKAENREVERHISRYHGHFERAVEYHQDWLELLDDPPRFDIVVLQSYRDENGGLESSYAEYARKFAEVIREHGAKMVLYITAQRIQNGEPLAEIPDPKPVLEQALAMAKLGIELDALVVPVPLAIQKLREKRLDLTTRYHTDAHLNQVCAYLTLCCFYATLLDRSPEGLDIREVNAWAGDQKDPDGNLMHRTFDEKTAVALQQAAWEAVQEFKILSEKARSES
jgi:hypothetical protein